MDDDQKELLKVGAEAAMKPFGDLFNKLFGGPVEQIGGMWTDGLVVRRQIRQISLMKKLQRAIDDAGFDPRLIPDNIWVPAIQEAVLHDDETIQELWANLLANAADPRRQNPVYPSFVLMAKELTSREAKFLDALHTLLLENNRTAFPSGGFTEYGLKTAYADAGLSRQPRIGPLSHGDFQEHGADLNADLREFSVALDLIMRLGILSEEVTTEPIDLADIAAQVKRKSLPSKLRLESRTKYIFTQLGTQFMNVCQRPTKTP